MRNGVMSDSTQMERMVGLGEQFRAEREQFNNFAALVQKLTAEAPSLTTIEMKGVYGEDSVFRRTRHGGAGGGVDGRTHAGARTQPQRARTARTSHPPVAGEETGRAPADRQRGRQELARDT